MTPVLIQLLFWIAVAFFLYVGVRDELSGRLLSALQVVILGPVIARVVAEIFIVVFRIHTRLSDIDDTLKATCRKSPEGNTSEPPQSTAPQV